MKNVLLLSLGDGSLEKYTCAKINLYHSVLEKKSLKTQKSGRGQIMAGTQLIMRAINRI